MKLPIVPSKLQKLWDAWDLRVCILTSLWLQAFLLLLAPSRQRSRSTLLSTSVWATYLLADWVAAVAIGLITKSLGDAGDPASNDDLFALWASFLLMHLGGPDGITSLSLEDNELWIRHLFGLILQVVSALYSFYLTLQKNKLWMPTVLVFVAGNIKFAERTMALRLASLDRFGATALPDPNPGPDYEEVAAEYSMIRSVRASTQGLEMAGIGGGIANFVGSEAAASAVDGPESRKSEQMRLLEVAYSLVGTFRVLIVGFLISSKDRDSSRSYFLRETPARAFRLVEYELSFIYQVLHTKSVVIHSTFGYILRVISFCSIIGASLSFLFVDKKGFGGFEIGVTYALFVGAIVLDTISILKLIFSDWILMAFKDTRFIQHVPSAILTRSRWSGSVSQKNMISYCLAPSIKFRELGRYLCKYGISETTKIILRGFSTYSEVVPKYLKVFIADELKKKSKDAISLSDAMEACSQRGNSALLQSSSSYIKLNWSIAEFQYTESLLLWHLATELCYHQDTNTSGRQREDDTLCKLFTRFCCKSCFCCGSCFRCRCCQDLSSSGNDEVDHKRVGKLLSDYMFYLLVKKPAMLAPVLGNWNIVFQDTCAETKRLFFKHKKSCHLDACEKIISVKPRVRAAALKGNRSRSVLFDACILAQQLKKEANKWEVISRVWVELLCYAAINCRPFVHAQQLSKGGELLTFAWLLMNHLGLGTQFAEQEQQVGTRMVTVIE